MANPRDTVAFDNIDQTNLTFKPDTNITYDVTSHGTNLRNRAVKASGDSKVELVGDADSVLGFIDHVEQDGKVVVTVDGAAKGITGAAQTTHAGARVVGCLGPAGALGYIRDAAANTAEALASGQTKILDASDQALVVVWL